MIDECIMIGEYQFQNGLTQKGEHEMKKILCILTAISLFIINTTSAFAHSLFDKRWNQGEYIIELTDEEIARYSAIFETALKKSEGTPTRQAFDEI